MTLREAAGSIPAGTYNVGFNGGDETQFDVSGTDELEECWLGFCREERCRPDGVDYVGTGEEC